VTQGLPPLEEAELQRRAETVALDTLDWPLLRSFGLHLRVRRDDALDPQLSGNKFYKLFFNLAEARVLGHRQLASFGGAWSNHLHALAAAGKRYGFATLGLVRGERPATLSEMLRDAQDWGMKLHFLPRSQYPLPGDDLMQSLRESYGDFYLIPEGGSNRAGARGLVVLGQALEAQLAGDYDQVCLASGTGTSLAGVAAGLPPGKLALGFSVLKGEGDLGRQVDRCWRDLGAMGEHHHRLTNWRLMSGYHLGGYGRKLPIFVRHFWQDFEQQTGLRLDPVYTLKLFWGIAQLAQQGYWRPGTRLVAIHTGGLQGRRGFLADEKAWTFGKSPSDKRKG
jgi:1-aminocyclopropane-1-carboxylate deaminase